MSMNSGMILHFLQICVDYDIAPSKYLNMKMVFMSKTNVDGMVLTPAEQVVFNYLKQVRWLRQQSRPKKKHQKNMY